MAQKPTEQALANLQDWQHSILGMAADFLCAPAQKELQSQSDVWDSGSIAYPSRNQVNILPSATMVFDVIVTDPTEKTAHVIHFSTWMTTGEVRIGVKVPISLASTVTFQNEISSSYNGAPCSREAGIGYFTFFDWIFKEDFAAFEPMIRAMKDPLMGAVLSRRIGEILTHLYFTVMGKLTRAVRGEVVLFPHREHKVHSLRLVSVSGNKMLFEAILADFRARVIDFQASAAEPGAHLFWVETEDEGCRLTMERDQFSATEIYAG